MKCAKGFHNAAALVLLLQCPAFAAPPLSESSGCLNEVLTELQARQTDRIREINSFYKKHRRLPSSSGKERPLYRWFFVHKDNENIISKLDPELQSLAAIGGKAKQKQSEMISEINALFEAERRLPTNLEERLYSWLRKNREDADVVKQLTPAVQEALGAKPIRDNSKIAQGYVDRINGLFKKHGRLPSVKLEKVDYQWLRNNSSKAEIRRLLDPEVLQAIASKPRKRSTESIWENNIYDLNLLYEKFGRLPKSRSAETETVPSVVSNEAKLRDWIRYNQEKKQDLIKAGLNPEILELLAKELPRPAQIQKNIDTVNALFRAESRLPSAANVGSEERTLAQWLRANRSKQDIMASLDSGVLLLLEERKPQSLVRADHVRKINQIFRSEGRLPLYKADEVKTYGWLRENQKHALAMPEIDSGARELIKKLNGRNFFQNISKEELISFLKEQDIEDLLEAFSGSPSVLVELLDFVRPDAFRDRSVAELVKSYIGLSVANGNGRRGIIRPQENSARQAYLEAVMRAIQRNEAIDLSKERLAQQKKILVRLSRKDFQRDGVALVSDLRAQGERLAMQKSGVIPTRAASFLADLYSQVADHYSEVLAFKVSGMKTSPFPYQVEGAQFLASRDAAILADEAGLGKTYQVLAAIQTQELKKTLWVTTAANKQTVVEEIIQHSMISQDEVQTIISGDPVARARQIQSNDKTRIIITNYESLVALRKGDPDSYKKLTSNLDVLVVDEAQYIDNPDALRTKAIGEVTTKRKWLISATPYQSKVDNLWTTLNFLDPERYSDKKAFADLYATDTNGLARLHQELNSYMLRRTKSDTVDYFQPGSVATLETQLLKSQSLLPRKVSISPESTGAYTLSREQFELIAQITSDFAAFAQKVNNGAFGKNRRIDLDKINSLGKFEWIHRVIYEPEWFGIAAENPIYKSLDRILEQKIQSGEKVILWAWNSNVISNLENRYKKYGVTRIDGDVTGAARENARTRFQNDPSSRILVANYVSGGVGLTLTAADSAIFVQLPLNYPLLYQAEGRHQRVISLNNLKFAKEKVESLYLVPQYDSLQISALRDPELRQIFENGTLVEQTFNRLEGGRTLYNMVMEGVGDPSDIDLHFKKSIFNEMGLLSAGKLSSETYASERLANLVASGRAFAPLWKNVKDAGLQESFLNLVDKFSLYPDEAARLAQAISQSGAFFSEDISLFERTLEIKNKYIREKILKSLPSLIERSYKKGKSLTQNSEALFKQKVTPTFILGELFEEGVSNQAIKKTLLELSENSSSSMLDHQREKLQVSLLSLEKSEAAKKLLKNNEQVIASLSLSERVDFFYKLGLVATLKESSLQRLLGSKSIVPEIDDVMFEALASEAQLDLGQLRNSLVQDSNWQGKIETILALYAGYREVGDVPSQKQLVEVLTHVAKRDFHEWRSSSNIGKINFIPESKKFWSSFRKNVSLSKRLSDLSKESKWKEVIEVIEELQAESLNSVTKSVGATLENFERLSETQRRSAFDKAKLDLDGVGKAIAIEANLEKKLGMRMKKSELEWTLGWMQLKLAKSSESPPSDQIVESLLESTSRIKSLHRKYSQPELEEKFVGLSTILRKFRNEDSDGGSVIVQETDHPADIFQMGAPCSGISNCFNPNGNPNFNKFVIGVAGSPNVKLVRVLDDRGAVLAQAVLKVKRLEDGTPVLFLERGIGKNGLLYQQEMLELLRFKAKELSALSGLQVKVLYDTRGRSLPTDPFVFGTGFYSPSEYVEPLFGFRNSNSVKHRGRVFE